MTRPAICAGCLEPIPKSGTDSKFVVSGTEVFHSRCASLIGQSVLTRYKLRLQEIRSELATYARNATSSRTQLETALQEARNDADRWRRERNQMYDEKARAESALREAVADSTRTSNRVVDSLSQSAQLTRDLTEARRDLAEAKAELAKARGQQPTTNEEKQTTAQDDAVTRAGLLELD